MNRVRLLRFERGLTSSQVSEQAEVSRPTLAAVERGQEPSAPVAAKLANFYGVTVADLLGFADDDQDAAA